MILKNVYMAFFHCKNFINWAHKLHLTYTFLLTLEIEFERGLYLHDKGYDTDTNYDLSQPLKRTTDIYVVTAVTENSFYPMGPQESGMYALMSTTKGGPWNPHSSE